MSVTFEVVGAEWAERWLNLPFREWIRDVIGKPINSQFTLGNAPLGRFTYQPSAATWDMMLLRASFGSELRINMPDDALSISRKGRTAKWFEARVVVDNSASPLFCPVTYFASIFDEGLAAKIDGVKELALPLLARIAERFKMPATLKLHPGAFQAQLRDLLLRAEHLAVYDVGQGAAQALVRLDAENATPELYVDMGCGRNHVQDVALPKLRFCTSASPLVILSHADEDHWCGALTKAMGVAGYPANKLKWTVPATAGSAAFMAFARSVWTQGGSVMTLDLAGKSPVTIRAKTGTGTLLIAQGKSKQFNHSGLIVAVVRKENEHYWLLPGDCDYHYFPKPLSDMAKKQHCVALAAFHHGAVPEKPLKVPHAVVGDYRRLVYSFGSGNTHEHPTMAAVNGHHGAGWSHCADWLKAPGVAPPEASSHVRATAWTPAAPPVYRHAGGVLIGWSAPPMPPPVAACCVVKCTGAIPTQV